MRSAEETDDSENERNAKRLKSAENEREKIVWPEREFDLIYVVWACQQFPEGFCIDFRGRWLKSRHDCSVCNTYVCKSRDIDSLCENSEMRTKISEKFSERLGIDFFEQVEFLLCNKHHGARSFEYLKPTNEGDESVEVKFKGIRHLGWPEFSTLLHVGQFTDLTVDLGEQCLTLKLAPNQNDIPFDREEAAIALVGHYLRSSDPSLASKEDDVL